MPSLLKPAATWTTQKDIRYTTASPGVAGLADVYVPDNGQAANPAIVWAHGGGWMSGDKTTNASRLYPLVQAGFVVVSINYRLSQEAVWPAQVVDFRAAVRAVRANASTFKAWPGKVGAAGASAGGQIALCAALAGPRPDWDVGDWPGVSSDVAAVLDDYAPTDLPAWVRSGVFPPPSWMVNPLLGGSVDQQPVKAKDASPVSWATTGDVPTLIRWGTADTMVPAAQNTRLRDLLAAAGVPVSTTVVSGAAHDDSAFYTASRMAAVAAFFDQHLRL